MLFDLSRGRPNVQNILSRTDPYGVPWAVVVDDARRPDDGSGAVDAFETGHRGDAASQAFVQRPRPHHRRRNDRDDLCALSGRQADRGTPPALLDPAKPIPPDVTHAREHY